MGILPDSVHDDLAKPCLWHQQKPDATEPQASGPLLLLEYKSGGSYAHNAWAIRYQRNALTHRQIPILLFRPHARVINDVASEATESRKHRHSSNAPRRFADPYASGSGTSDQGRAATLLATLVQQAEQQALSKLHP